MISSGFSSTAQACRWTSRLLSGLFLLFVGATVVGIGPPGVALLGAGDAMMFAWFATMLVGFAVLWWREALGGVLATVGVLGFYASNDTLSGRLPSGAFMAMLFLPGLLALASSWMRSHRRPRVRSAPRV